MKIRLILPVLAFFMAGTISAAGADGTMCSPGGFGCRDTLDICAHG